MKTLVTSNQASFSWWAIRPASVALVATVAMVCVATWVGSQPSQAQGGAVAPQIEGSWLATITIPDVPPFPSLLTFGAGGALVVTDGSVSPASGHVYQGTWARKGDHQIVFSFWGLNYDAAGVLVGYLRVHETIKLDPSRDAYNSVVSKIEVLDVNQNVVFGPVEATTHGTRINAE
jgi:hypothetical protein